LSPSPGSRTFGEVAELREQLEDVVIEMRRGR
jgi:hypothetical protein